MNTTRFERRHRPPIPFRFIACVRLVLLFGVTLLLAPGCSLFGTGVWSDATSLDGLLTKSSRSTGETGTTHHNISTLTHQSRETISLAVEFRHVPSAALGDAMWRSVDETALDSRLRQSWLANGLRIGVLSSLENVPGGDVESAGRMNDPINALFAGAEVLAGKADGREIIPLRPSRRHELPLAPALDGTQTVLLQQTGGLVGRTVDNPQLLLALTAENGPRQGQSTLHLRPEIQHGAVRQKFVSSDTAVRIQSGRERWELPELDFKWSMRSGAILVIAPVMQAGEGVPTFGLGRQMMRDPDHLVDDQHIVAFLQVEK